MPDLPGCVESCDKDDLVVSPVISFSEPPIKPDIAERSLPPKATLDIPVGSSDLEKGRDKPAPARKFQVSYVVRAGGAALTFTAGLVNAVAFYALSTFVSHVTGAFSRGALGIYDSDTGGTFLKV